MYGKRGKAYQHILRISRAIHSFLREMRAIHLFHWEMFLFWEIPRAVQGRHYLDLIDYSIYDIIRSPYSLQVTVVMKIPLRSVRLLPCGVYITYSYVI